MKFTQEFKDENTRFEKIEEEFEDSRKEHRKVQRAIKQSMVKRIQEFSRDHYLGETIASHGSEYWTEGASFIGRYFTTNGEPTDVYLLSVKLTPHPYPEEPVPTFRYAIHSGICFQEKKIAVLEMLTQTVKGGRIYVNRWKGDLAKKDEATPEKEERIEDITDALFSFTENVCFEQKGRHPHQYTDSQRRGFLLGIPIAELDLSVDEHKNIIRMIRYKDAPKIA